VTIRVGNRAENSFSIPTSRKPVGIVNVLQMTRFSGRAAFESFGVCEKYGRRQFDFANVHLCAVDANSEVVTYPTIWTDGHV